MLIKPHHSYEDWDFSTTAWDISPDDFVSPPTALRHAPPGAAGVTLLCKRPRALTLSQGRIVVYFKQTFVPCFIYFIFRNILSPGNSNWDNCYRVMIGLSAHKYSLEERVDGALPRYWWRWITDYDPALWHHWRSTWWLSWGIMLHRLEREIDGVWIAQGDDISVENPLFGISTYQRPGIQLERGATAGPVLADNAQIWILP